MPYYIIENGYVMQYLIVVKVTYLIVVVIAPLSEVIKIHQSRYLRTERYKTRAACSDES